MRGRITQNNAPKRMTQTVIMYAILALIALVVAYQVGAQATRHAENTAAMAVYANFAGVWPVFPTTPDDRTVYAKADYIREQLVKHGNHYNVEVVPYVYGMTLSDGFSTAASDFEAFLFQASLDYHRRRVAHISDRAKKDPRAAAQHFGGQTIFEPTNKEYIK